MRKLTIKRTKSFVGCLGTMKVYIEDSQGDTKILDCQSRKLGEIKNGEEVSFDIDEQSAKLFVIADKLSADYCNDCYQLPEGDDDIFLSGRNKFNPALGNAFRFDGNVSTVTTETRNKGLKKGVLVVLCSMLIGLAFGFGVTTGIFELIRNQEETFTTGEMTITLTKEFNQQSHYGYAGVFLSDNVEVLVLKEDLSYMSTLIKSAEEYTKGVLEYQKLDFETVTEDGLTSFVYSNEAKDGNVYKYRVYGFLTEDTYWCFYFAVKENKAEKYADKINDWAKTISFN